MSTQPNRNHTLRQVDAGRYAYGEYYIDREALGWVASKPGYESAHFQTPESAASFLDAKAAA